MHFIDIGSIAICVTVVFEWQDSRCLQLAIALGVGFGFWPFFQGKDCTEPD